MTPPIPPRTPSFPMRRRWRPLVATLGALSLLAVPAGAQTGSGPELSPFDRAHLHLPSRSIALTCPPEEVPPAGFSDVPADNVHVPAINCLRHRGLTEGVGENRYHPAGLVTRAQMATFVARLMEESGGELPTQPPDAFADDDGSAHEASINQVAALGVVAGKSAGTFDPGGHVTRAQMASLMVNAVEHRLELELSLEDDHFGDDAGNVHERSINKAARAGVVAGVGDGRYDPLGVVVRDQVASFAVRALDVVVTRPSWERAVELIRTCQVEGASQGHDLSASVTLKDGTTHRTTQPYIDAIADELYSSDCPGPLTYATE